MAQRRRLAFVGRASETELFEAALEADDLQLFSVMYVYGPGGVGKSSLLAAFAEIAEGRGARVLRVDGRAVVPTRPSLEHALAPALEHPAGGGPGTTPRTVVLIDSYDRLAALDGWLRSDLLPGLPASTLTVVAGRKPPSQPWRSDPAWRDLLRIVALHNLKPDESRSYLLRSGVDETQHARLVDVSRGHPLALSLLADLVLRGRDPGLDPLTPDLVAALVRRFVDSVPTPLQRRALEVCAVGRVTTEALLRDALELDDSHDLFGWLRGLSFVETTPEGLIPHDLARDVLDVDLRWRDPETYEQVFRSVRAHVHRRLATASGTDQQRAIFDEKFAFRNLPSVLSPVDWEAWGEHYPEPAGAGDRDVILDMVLAAEGTESAAIAEQWLRHQPSAFFLIRGDDGEVRGFVALVTLAGADPAVDPAFDPGARAALDFAERTSPPRPGEVVTQTRFVIDRHRYQAPSPTLNATPILTLQRYLQTPKLAWDFLALAEPDHLNDYFALAGLPRAEGADFRVGGGRYGLFAHDFRKVPVDAWLELVTERALRQDGPPPPAAIEVLVLSHTAFVEAVRQALRDLAHPELLARNPLRRTRLGVSREARDPNGDVVGDLVRQALEALRAHPRDDKRWRAVDRTYLRPAPTQERAAELLGLPFSTYRRHLTEGVSRVADFLWDLEVRGVP